ncbi:MAG: response regulator [Candidatus Pacebacteria bacterium]|nr:response regulator [Candidatus Paceibacterota bacterium]
MEGEKKKILLVDDDGFLLDMYAFKFSQNNFDVFTATNGKQALEKIKEGLSPEIMMIDIIMPELNGFETLEKIKEENLLPNTIKIILSNKNQTADIERGNSLGVSGYIIKANTVPSEVVAQVHKILEEKTLKNLQ